MKQIFKGNDIFIQNRKSKLAFILNSHNATYYHQFSDADKSKLVNFYDNLISSYVNYNRSCALLLGCRFLNTLFKLEETIIDYNFEQKCAIIYHLFADILNHSCKEYKDISILVTSLLFGNRHNLTNYIISNYLIKSFKEV